MGKPAPKFWWDFWYGNATEPQGVVVQGDYPGGEALDVFKPSQARANAGLEAEIAQADALIADFKAGRSTPQWGRKAPD